MQAARHFIPFDSMGPMYLEYVINYVCVRSVYNLLQEKHSEDL